MTRDDYLLVAALVALGLGLLALAHVLREETR